MCSICGQFNCASWCPFNIGKRIFTCDSCGSGICDGEKYYKIGKKYFHKECLVENYCKEELLLIFGATPRVASEGEAD